MKRNIWVLVLAMLLPCVSVADQLALPPAPEQKALPASSAASSAQKALPPSSAAPSAQKALPPSSAASSAQKALPAPSTPAQNITPSSPAANAVKPSAPAQGTPSAAKPSTPSGGGAKPAGGSPAAAAASATKALNVAGVVTGAVGVVAGASMVADAHSEKDRKADLADLGQAAIGGAVAGSSAALLFNSIPVAGQIAYGTATLVGTALGATTVGLKIFSETDCALDQVLTANKGFDVYQCCHTSQKLSTITHANYVNIGDYMFCPKPGMVSQCIQQQYVTGNINRNPNVNNVSWDDKWEGCKERWCHKKPDNNATVIFVADYDNHCWDWKCPEGMVKSGTTCVKATKKCIYNGNKYDLGAIMETKKCSDVNVSNSDLKTGQQCKVSCLQELAFGELKSVWSIETCPAGKRGVNLSNPNKYNPAATGYKKCVKDSGSCKSSRSSAEGKACCDLPDKVAKWDGTHCVCQAAGAKFEIQNGKGVCVTSQSCETLYKGNDEAIACCNAGENWIDGKCQCQDETKTWDKNARKCIDDDSSDNEEMSNCYYQFNVTVRCNNGRSYDKNVQYPLTKEQAEELSCRGGNIVDQLSGSSFGGKTGPIWENEIRNVQGMQKLMDLICGGSSSGYVPGVTPYVAPQGPSAAEVKSAADKLSAFTVSAESNRNVWKDAEGKFNTARLASDLTAGVVLGTVGGVVSGVVIKKKQVQKGFEALHCTVGGQTIADWGDDFSVGLR